MKCPKHKLLDVVPNRRSCLLCLERARISSKERRQQNPEYRRQHYLANREKAIALSKKWHQDHKERWMKGRREYRAKVRAKILEKYGNHCARCGFDNVLALQVDHVGGGGRLERKLPGMGKGSTMKYLKTILEDTEGRYQLLCANCNIIKYWESIQNSKEESK